MSVGENIKRIRREKGITQGGLAKQLEITQAMMCYIERGTRCPSLVTGKLIADALGVTMEDLLKE